LGDPAFEDIPTWWFSLPAEVPRVAVLLWAGGGGCLHKHKLAGYETKTA
jgi:hypothetical protein